MKKCKMHSGGVYALVTNRIMLPRAGESNPLLALARQLESSRSVIDRVTKANVPEHDVTHSPLRLPYGSGKDVLEEHTSYVDAASAAEVQTAPTDEGLPFVSCVVVLVVRPWADSGVWRRTQLVWSASADFTIVAWDVRGRYVQSYTGHSNQVRSLCSTWWQRGRSRVRRTHARVADSVASQLSEGTCGVVAMTTRSGCGMSPVPTNAWRH